MVRAFRRISSANDERFENVLLVSIYPSRQFRRTFIARSKASYIAPAILPRYQSPTLKADFNLVTSLTDKSVDGFLNTLVVGTICSGLRGNLVASDWWYRRKILLWR